MDYSMAKLRKVGVLIVLALAGAVVSDLRAEGATGGAPGLFGDVNEAASVADLSIKNPVRPLDPTDDPLVPSSVSQCGTMGGAVVPMALMMFAGLKSCSPRRRRHHS